jgi:hypothetical protein
MPWLLKCSASLRQRACHLSCGAGTESNWKKLIPALTSYQGYPNKELANGVVAPR